MPGIPGPINVTLTVKEAAAMHLQLTCLVRVFDEAGEKVPDRRQVDNGISALHRELRKAGCVLDAEGWKV